ncbi:MAG: TRAP transporter substrate-binding protein DctP [Brevibacillus sp.]|nr:TRAP transporter substrate-binding protein DctP [Brevibacillus sp.]
MKRTVMGLLLSLVMMFVSACGQQSAENGGGSGQADDGKVYTLKVGTALSESDPIYQGLEAFRKAVEEKTNGKVEIEIYGSGSLGDDKDILEQAKVGANVAVLVDSGRLAEMVPQMGIMTAPYIVDNFDEARKVVTSDLFKGWEEQLAKDHGLRVLSFNWYQGERHLLTNKPVLKPEDLEGVRLRTPGAPIWLETIKAMGANPTGMAWSEVYVALQQGIIDGAEAQHPATYGAKLYEVIKHISKTRHFQLLTGIVASDKWMAELPEEYQKIVLEEAFKAGDDASRKTEELLGEFEQKLADQGVEIHEVDVNLFKERTNVVYEKFEGYTELRDQINQLLGK